MSNTETVFQKYIVEIMIIVPIIIAFGIIILLMYVGIFPSPITFER